MRADPASLSYGQAVEPIEWGKRVEQLDQLERQLTERLAGEATREYQAILRLIGESAERDSLGDFATGRAPPRRSHAAAGAALRRAACRGVGLPVRADSRAIWAVMGLVAFGTRGDLKRACASGVVQRRRPGALH